jgi:hypothetical protein
MTTQSDIAKMLGLASDEQNNEQLKTIVSLTEARLRVLLSLSKDDPIPDELDYIVTEVAISRFNRIGSEGLSSHSVEGETMQWSEGDFAPYYDDIQAYLDAQENPSTKRGRVKFI